MHRVASMAVRSWFIVAAVLALSACAVPTRIEGVEPKLPERTTETVIDETLDTFENPARQDRIADLMTTRAMRDAQEALVSGLMDATIESLQEDERRARLASVAEKYTEAIGAAIIGDVSARLDRERGALQGAIAAAISSGTRAAMHELVRALDQELGPALREIVAEQARAAGRGVVEGATDALTENEGRDQEGGVVTDVSRLARRGTELATALAIAFGLATVFLLVWIAKLLAEANREKQRARSRRRRPVASRTAAHA